MLSRSRSCVWIVCAATGLKRQPVLHRNGTRSDRCDDLGIETAPEPVPISMKMLVHFVWNWGMLLPWR